MIASDARVNANRLNALKSTGPRTAEGKERSRCNAVKHGLTGEGVALSIEDAAAVEARFVGFRADYRPTTEAGTALVHRAALLSIRLERSAVREAAAISVNVRAAEADFDEARETTVDDLFAMLDENPGRAVRRLSRMPEGVDRLLDAWADLREDVAVGDGSRWTDDHSAMAILLTGRKVGGFGVARVEALGMAIGGDFSLLGGEDGAGLDASGRKDWARRAMVELIDATAMKLMAHRETLDFEAIEADRAGAAARALFDPSKEATLARKYEAAAEREMHRAIREMKEIEAEASAAAGGRSGDVSPSPLGSFSPLPARRPVASPPVPAPVPAMPPGSRFGAQEGSSFVAMNIGRAEKVLS